MKKVLTFLLLILFSTSSFSKAPAEISVLTCSPGDEIYSVFGHSAIRVQDTIAGTDVIYNFGLFSFGTSLFAIKFAMKTLYYSLGIQYPESFINSYTRENRTVKEQRLLLSEEQRKKIIEELEYRYLPENRDYLYAFLEKNCATEIRDILMDNGVPLPVHDIDSTNRFLLNSYLTATPWLKLGINMALGSMIDKENDSYQSMFLPDFLHEGLKQTTIDGTPVVREELQLNSIQEIERGKMLFLLTPLFIFGLLFFIILFWDSKLLSLFFFSVIGLVGLVLLSLWIFSGHVEVKNNFNLLWCSPLYLLYIPSVLKNRKDRLLSSFLLLTLLLTLVIWVTGIQIFDPSIIPLLCTLLLLNIRQWRDHLSIAHALKSIRE